MCDWVTHLAVAWILGEALNLRKGRIALLVGAVLPDSYKLLTIPLEKMGFFAATPEAILFLEPFHSLIGGVLVSLAASALFGDDVRRVFPLLFLGYTSHLLLDCLLPFGPPLLLPISPIYFGLQLIWQEDWLPAVVATAAAFALTSIRSWSRGGYVGESS